MKDNKIEIPESVFENGVYNLGVFRREFKNVNVIDGNFYKGIRNTKFFKKLKLKEWQHFSIISENYYVGILIFDAKYIGSSFVYLYNRKSGEVIEFASETVMGTLGVADSLYRGTTFYIKRKYQIEVENNLASGFHKIDINIKNLFGTKGIRGELTVHENQDEFEPLVAVLNIEGFPFYTHKNLCPVSGSLEVAGKEIVFNREKDFCLIDVQKTVYPYKTFWHWFTFGGFDENGNFIGINLTLNNIKDDASLNENCLWLNGKMVPLGNLIIQEEKGAFVIQTGCDRVNLFFDPVLTKTRVKNFGIIKSVFKQSLGKFSGKVSADHSNTYAIKNFFGVKEYHIARW